MNFLGIDISLKNTPSLDPQFIPMAVFNREFLKQANTPITLCIERDGGKKAVYDTYITASNPDADKYYIERLVKYLLWSKGGFKVYIYGCDKMAAHVKDVFSPTGKYGFDNGFMSKIYEQPFEVITANEKPVENEVSRRVGGKTGGCRIGFDAGGSDRKVSAVIDGEAVFSEEVVWHPKITPDPDYHFNGILDAMRKAASKMPRVDSIGVSSAGIYINNRTMAASLFLKVSPADFDAKVKDIYIRAAKEIGKEFGKQIGNKSSNKSSVVVEEIPLTVVNDGDVTALAGAMAFGDNNVLGIAMGTSEAAGYIDNEGNIKGWLNELAFCPVDASPNAMRDEWSGDIGCGVKYFSQDGVIKLAAKAGIKLDESLSPGEKLKHIQGLLANDDIPGNDTAFAKDIFRSIGCYLGHTLPYYWDLYRFKNVLLLGRVMSGVGGDLILSEAKRVLSEEYADYNFNIHTPDEKMRRVGQSVAAASL